MFKYLDGFITVDTTTGKATITDADGVTDTLEEVAADLDTLTEAQRERINQRFGHIRKDGQPF